jgi:hypothetical protein
MSTTDPDVKEMIEGAATKLKAINDNQKKLREQLGDSELSKKVIIKDLVRNLTLKQLSMEEIKELLVDILYKKMKVINRSWLIDCLGLKEEESVQNNLRDKPDTIEFDPKKVIEEDSIAEEPITVEATTHGTYSSSPQSSDNTDIVQRPPGKSNKELEDEFTIQKQSEYIKKLQQEIQALKDAPPKVVVQKPELDLNELEITLDPRKMNMGDRVLVARSDSYLIKVVIELKTKKITRFGLVARNTPAAARGLSNLV